MPGLCTLRADLDRRSALVCVMFVVGIALEARVNFHVLLLLHLVYIYVVVEGFEAFSTYFFGGSGIFTDNLKDPCHAIELNNRRDL